MPGFTPKSFQAPVTMGAPRAICQFCRHWCSHARDGVVYVALCEARRKDTTIYSSCDQFAKGMWTPPETDVWDGTEVLLGAAPGANNKGMLRNDLLPQSYLRDIEAPPMRSAWVHGLEQQWPYTIRDRQPVDRTPAPVAPTFDGLPVGTAMQMLSEWFRQQQRQRSLIGQLALAWDSDTAEHYEIRYPDIPSADQFGLALAMHVHGPNILHLIITDALMLSSNLSVREHQIEGTLRLRFDLERFRQLIEQPTVSASHYRQDGLALVLRLRQHVSGQLTSWQQEDDDHPFAMGLLVQIRLQTSAILQTFADFISQVGHRA